MTVLPREFYDRPVLDVARDLLGVVVVHAGVSVRLSEVEAYDGELDPASHAFRGPTPRNEVMYGPPGYVYVYFTYGMHFCMNLVCGPPGRASAVLLRAGEVVDGLDVAQTRRPGIRPRDLARGPARLTLTLAVDRAAGGSDVTSTNGALQVHAGTPAPDNAVCRGPRVGVSTGAETPWRFWIDGDPTVSVYRAHVARKRGSTGDRRRS